MEAKELQRLLIKDRTKMIGTKLNPELVDILDKAIDDDPAVDNRSDLLLQCIINYLEKRNVLK
jgi:metal-responsive CopG/Arc/MetJ family transcriptional regulator